MLRDLSKQANSCNSLSDLGRVAYIIDPTSQASIEALELPHNMPYFKVISAAFLLPRIALVVSPKAPPPSSRCERKMTTDVDFSIHVTRPGDEGES